MPYGTLKLNTLIFDNGSGTDVSVAMNNVATKASPTFTGTITSNAVLNQAAAFNMSNLFTQPVTTVTPSSNTITLDASTGNYWYANNGSATISTWNFTNLPATNKHYLAFIRMKYANTNSVGWTVQVSGSSKTVYDIGDLPAVVSGKSQFFTLQTEDAGNTWRMSWSKLFDA